MAVKKREDCMQKHRTLIIAALCLVGFCAIAVFFRVFPLGELPASFIGAALGAVITGVVTVVLLEGQSRAEEVKERNVKVFEQKSAIFQQYINQVWKVWEDQKITAEEFQELTANYYSKLMIFLKDDASVGKISDCLAKIGDCIDKETLEDYKILRDNIIEIINTLSDKIDLGGRINKEKVEELDSKMFPVIFKKILVEEFTNKLSEDRDLFYKPQLKRGYRQNLEYLIFDFKKYPKCKIVIGPFDAVNHMKIGLDISRQLHQFNKFRQPVKKYSYWIKTFRSDTGTDLVLNDRLPQDEDADEIENGINFGVINKFAFNDIKSLEQYRGNFRKVAALLAQRAGYYLNTVTINKEFSMAELPAVILDNNNPVV
jgi:hypothetical protein